MYTTIKSGHIYYRFTALVSASFFFLSLFATDILALAPQSGLQNPITRREYQMVYLANTHRLTFAESDEDIKFLQDRNHAKALLLPHGKIIAHRDLKNDLGGLVRAVVHEEVEAIMQIMAEDDESKYSTLINMVLSEGVKLPDKYLTAEEKNKNKNKMDLRDAFIRLFPEESVSRIAGGVLDDDLLANHIVAKAFEIIIARNENLLTGKMSDEETLFLSAIEKMINANKHNYFTGVFWEDSTRGSEIRVAMANGMSFVQVNNTAEEPQNGGAEKSAEDRPIEKYRKIITDIESLRETAKVYGTEAFSDESLKELIKNKAFWHDDIFSLLVSVRQDYADVQKDFASALDTANKNIDDKLKVSTSDPILEEKFNILSDFFKKKKDALTSAVNL